MAYHEATPQGVNKVERYNWSLQDSPGELRSLHKSQIKFDESYQRIRNDAKIRSIARDWSWLALGVITIAERDGAYYAVDGMHRASAALLRSDVSHLPCIVFKSTGLKDEAEGFVRANTNRKAVSTADKHRAQVIAGDENAVFVQSLLDSSGLTVSTSGNYAGQVRCMGVLHRLAREKRDALIRAWPLVLEVCEGHPLNERVLSALVYLADHGSHDINEKKWRERVVRLGFFGVKNAAESAAAYYSKGGAKVWADGVMQAINKGLHHKMVFEDDRA